VSENDTHFSGTVTQSREAAPEEMCAEATAEDWQWLRGCDVLP